MWTLPVVAFYISAVRDLHQRRQSRKNTTNYTQAVPSNSAAVARPTFRRYCQWKRSSRSPGCRQTCCLRSSNPSDSTCCASRESRGRHRPGFPSRHPRRCSRLLSSSSRRYRHTIDIVVSRTARTRLGAVVTSRFRAVGVVRLVAVVLIVADTRDVRFSPRNLFFSRCLKYIDLGRVCDHHSAVVMK
jgi:hypothetical protein